MKHQRLTAFLLALLLLASCAFAEEEGGEALPGGIEAAQAMDETATNEPEPAANEPAPPVDAEPEPVAPEPEPVTPEPVTPEPVTPEPATEEPVTPQPVTAAPVTPEPVWDESGDYPRAVFSSGDVLMDASGAVPGGRLLVGLPVTIEATRNSYYASSDRGSVGGWVLGGPSYPGYFNQYILSLGCSLDWTLTEADVPLNALFDLSGGTTRSALAYAPQNNNWGVAAGTPYNAGYAVFDLPILPTAPAGRHRLRFVYDTSRLMNPQNIEITVDFSIAGESPSSPTAPSQGVQPTAAPQITDAPADPGNSDQPGPSGGGSVMLGQMTTPTLTAGDTGVTLAVPVSYSNASVRIYSNRSASGSVLEPGASGFSQEIVDYVEWLEVAIDESAADDDTFPFELSGGDTSQTVVADGVNYGYAVFSDLTVRDDLSSGTAVVPLVVSYVDVQSGEVRSADLSAVVNVTGGSSSGGSGGGYSYYSYSGGGGGGSYSSPTAAPQARVLVESIATNPAEVKAGDSFDLVLMLRNTSTRQYVQNMRVTIGSEEDALIPQNGSNTLYIDRIDAEALYELRYPVRASLEVPDRPLKIDVTIEYEDSAVSAQSAVQQLVISVTQQMRLSIGDPVLDASSLFEGDSADVTLQVINEGRTTLYNVAVTAQSDSDSLVLPATAYLGNMEGGTSRRAELSLTPTQAGDYSAALLVTWEDAAGQRFSDSRSVSFTAQADTTSDYWSTPAYDSSVLPTVYEEEQGMDLRYLLELMPWWIYAGAAGVYLLIVVYIALSVRARRRKALEDEDDEME